MSTDTTPTTTDTENESNVHHIVVSGRDIEPLLPITKERVPADRVRLYPLETGNTDETATMVAEYERITELVGLETTVTDPFENFRTLYSETFVALRDDLERGHNVWVNVAGVTNPTGFAPITAAASLALSSTAAPDQIHVYAADDDGQPWTIPTAVQAPPRDLGEQILETIDHETPDSVTAVARSLSDDDDNDDALDGAFRSKIQYNVGLLEERGLIRMVDDGYRKQPKLTAAGALYLEAQSEN
ncbi:hypothetical protein [Natronorubrum daqingense]|uniref:Uncharacterized protein n=1 Tax=Natronorubrum daqingense TaxID=588898 RepID=A0A1N7G056_9EURY|nr:hypothetical protein [Natronorubrum daqingense]APX98603.1 hypothetical protein BB347_18060 [Natronorubrum daqingense]SIS05982.1 hypothetical protein SAMN05421809_3627 [Natronorubrum daqingense]